jgi:hypothetical protein
VGNGKKVRLPSIQDRWPEDLPRDWTKLTPQQKVEVAKKLITERNRVMSERAGYRVEDAWEEHLKREFRYVFKNPEMRPGWSSATVETDYVVGDDLKNLKLIESKRTPFTGWSDAERTSYPEIKRSGGYIVSEYAPNLADGGRLVRVGGQRAFVKPNNVQLLFPSDLAAVQSGQKTLQQVLSASNWYQRPRPKGSDLYVPLDRLTAAKVDAEPGGLLKARQRRGPTFAQRAGLALEAGTEQAARLALRTFRGLRTLGSFAVRMVIPPLHPGAIVIEIIFFVLTELITRYFEEQERKNFQKQLDRLPPRVEALVKAHRESAASALLASVDRGGPGFVYARITATVTRKVTQEKLILPGEEWDVTIDSLDWDEWYSVARAKVPVETEKYKVKPPPVPVRDPVSLMIAAVPTREYEKKTTVVFNVSEPIFTPFDWLLGALQWLDETLLFVYETQTGIPGGIGPVVPGTDKKFLERYYEIQDWLTKLSKLLKQHRSAEELVGSEQVGLLRRAMIMDASRLMTFLAPKIQTLVPPDPKKNYYPMFEASQLASQIQNFLERCKKSESEGYYAKRDKPLPARITPDAFWKMSHWKGAPIP